MTKYRVVMKNLHLLPTDKPSRLYKHNELGFKLLAPVQHEMGAYNSSNQHIYITSDEEIKEGDWILDNILANKKPIKVTKELLEDGFLKEDKRIILTTDQDLIKDGVQPIDDEFLEWFVKNPSCEEVEVESFCKHGDSCPSKGAYDKQYLCDVGYKIIIPQEEPKDVVLGYKTSLDAQMLDKIELEEPKQETTLEEAAETWLYELENTNPMVVEKRYPLVPMKFGFIEGAKWQAEQFKYYLQKLNELCGNK